jgi:hypothetical protein
VLVGAPGGGQSGATLTLEEDPGRNKLKGKPATVRVAHDRKTLYVAVTVPLEKPGALKLSGKWGQDDGMEVCLRATAARNQPAFVLRGYPTGAFAGDTEGGMAPAEAEKLGKAARFTARVEGGSWTGEWAVPLEAAGLVYQPGLKLSFNIGVMRSETGEWLIWQGALGPTWKLDNAGVLVLE